MGNGQPDIEVTAGTDRDQPWVSAAIRYTPVGWTYNGVPEDALREVATTAQRVWCTQHLPFTVKGATEADYVRMYLGDDDRIAIELGGAFVTPPSPKPQPATRDQWTELLASHERLFKVLRSMEYMFGGRDDGPASCPVCDGCQPSDPVVSGEGHDKDCGLLQAIAAVRKIRDRWPGMFPESGNPTVPA